MEKSKHLTAALEKALARIARFGITKESVDYFLKHKLGISRSGELKFYRMLLVLVLGAVTFSASEGFAEGENKSDEGNGHTALDKDTGNYAFTAQKLHLNAEEKVNLLPLVEKIKQGKELEEPLTKKERETLMVALHNAKEQLEQNTQAEEAANNEIQTYLEKEGVSILENTAFILSNVPLFTAPFEEGRENFSAEEKEQLVRLFEGFTKNEVQMLVPVLKNALDLPQMFFDFAKARQFLDGIKTIGTDYFTIYHPIIFKDEPVFPSYITALLHAPKLLTEVMAYCNNNATLFNELFGNMQSEAIEDIIILGDTALLLEIMREFKNGPTQAVPILYAKYKNDPRLIQFFSSYRTFLKESQFEKTLDEEMTKREMDEKVNSFIKNYEQNPIEGISIFYKCTILGYAEIAVCPEEKECMVLSFDRDMNLVLYPLSLCEYDEYIVDFLQKSGIKKIEDINPANGDAIRTTLSQVHLMSALESQLKNQDIPKNFFATLKIDKKFSTILLKSQISEEWLVILFDTSTGKILRISPSLKDTLHKHSIITIAHLNDSYEAVMKSITEMIESQYAAKQQEHDVAVAVLEELQEKIQLNDREFLRIGALIHLFVPKVGEKNMAMKPYIRFMTDFFSVSGIIDENGYFEFKFAQEGSIKVSFDLKFGEDFIEKFGRDIHTVGDFLKHKKRIMAWYKEKETIFENKKAEFEIQKIQPTYDLKEYLINNLKKIVALKNVSIFVDVPLSTFTDGANIISVDEYHMWVYIKDGKYFIEGFGQKEFSRDELLKETARWIKDAQSAKFAKDLFNKDTPTLRAVFEGEYTEEKLFLELQKGVQSFTKFLWTAFQEKHKANFNLFSLLAKPQYFDFFNDKEQQEILEKGHTAFADTVQTLESLKFEETRKRSELLLDIIARLDEYDIKQIKEVADAYLNNTTPEAATFLLATENINVKNKYFTSKLCQKAQKDLKQVSFSGYEGLDKLAFLNNIIKLNVFDQFAAHKEGLLAFLEGVTFDNFNSLITTLNQLKPYPEFYNGFLGNVMPYLAKGNYEIYKPFEAKLLLDLVKDNPDYQQGALEKIFQSQVVLEGELMDTAKDLVKANPKLKNALLNYLYHNENAIIAYLGFETSKEDIEYIIQNIEGFTTIFYSEFSTASLYELVQQMFPDHFARLRAMALLEDERANVWLVGLMNFYYIKDPKHPELERLQREIPESKIRFFALQIKKVAVAQDIQKEYNVRPRSYLGLLDTVGTTADIEKDFLQELRTATDFVNGVITERDWGFTVTPEEIFTTFMAEGGVLNMRSNDRSFNGFGALGIDTYGSDLENFNLRSLSLPELLQLNTSYYTNEKGERYKTFNYLNLKQAVHAVAAMYAFKKLYLTRHLTSMGKDIARLSPSEQFFWTTIYFNAGQGAGRKLLQEHGVQYAHFPWKREDSFSKYHHNPHYNGCWRTASFELALKTGAIEK